MEDRWRGLERAARAGDAEAQASLRTLRARVEPLTEAQPGAEVDYLGRVHLVLVDPPTSKFVLTLRLEDLLLAYVPPADLVPTGRGYPELLSAIEANRAILSQPGQVFAWAEREWLVGNETRRKRGLILRRLTSLDGERVAHAHGYSLLFWRRRVPHHLLPTGAERRGVVAQDELLGEVASLFTSAGNRRVANRNLFARGEEAVAPLLLTIERSATKNEVPDPRRPEVWQTRPLEEVFAGLNQASGLIGDLARKGLLPQVLAAAEGCTPKARRWLDFGLGHRCRSYSREQLLDGLQGPLCSAQSVGKILLARRGQVALDLLYTMGLEGPSEAHRKLARELLRSLATLGAWSVLRKLNSARRSRSIES